MLKTIYNNLVSFIENRLTSLHKIKMWGGEHYALLRKKKLYKNIQWNKLQKQEFDEYWKKYYGKKITSKGHKLYESINGTHHKDYFPDFLFATKLELKLNNYIYARIYSDKSLTELLYSKNNDFIMPDTYLLNSAGIWYNKNRDVISIVTAKNILTDIGECIIKPTLGGSSGKGVLFSNFKNGVDLNKETSIEDLFDSKNKDFIVQEKMEQHESFSNLYPHSINTIRIITYIAKGKVYHAKLCLRMGASGKKVDNIHSGGLVIGLKDNGRLLDQAFKLGYSDSSIIMEEHPNTKVKFKNHQLVSIPEVIEIAKKLHGSTPHIGIISWDFMVDKSANVVLIEANYTGQSIWFPQIVHKAPFFGEHTDYMINLIK